MKPIKFLATMIVVSTVFSFSACNSGTEEKKEASTDTSATTTAPVAPVVAPAGPTLAMIIRHKVADYSTWKMGYDGHDSNRVANGLHNYVVSRGTNDSNMVLVALKMDDVDKAKAFANSKDLKDRMKSLGIKGAPMVDFIESVLNDTTGIQSTVRVMVKHQVKDWDAWKKSFDSHQQTRIDAGLIDRVVAHTVGDTHHVTLVFAVTDIDKANAFMKSEDLKAKMKEAGVEGMPDIFFYKIVQKY